MRSKIIKRVGSVILSVFMLVAPLAALEGWAQEHWSLRPVSRPEVPKVAESGMKVRNPIDAFVLLRRHG